MEYDRFNQLVAEHRNSMVFIGVSILVFVAIGFLVVEFYVRRELDCPFFNIGKLRFSPTLLMGIPLIFVLIYFPIKVHQCNYDINNLNYETYVGEVEYSESSVKLMDNGISIFVGKGHGIIPQGNGYGKLIYSQKSHVVVYYEPISPN